MEANLYFHFLECGFKKFDTFDKKELSDLLKCICSNVVVMFRM